MVHKKDKGTTSGINEVPTFAKTTAIWNKKRVSSFVIENFLQIPIAFSRSFATANDTNAPANARISFLSTVKLSLVSRLILRSRLV